jgi:excisionase family DNA binding protein
MEKHLTPPEAAKLLRVSPKKVVAWIRDGRLRARNVAAVGVKRPQYRIPLSEWERFLTTLDEGPVAKAKRAKRGSMTLPPGVRKCF